MSFRFVSTGLIPCITFCLLLSACGDGGVTQDGDTAVVSDERLVNAGAEPHNWLNHGRTYSEQRYSPLDEINTQNVAQLKLAWHLDLPSRRGLEATPLVVDGRMYTTGTWSRVYALDAASGALLWEYDPRVPPQKGIDACCDVVNRGVALWRDMVYVGTLDGRLIALDATSGREAWSVQTTPADRRYTITGAPRIVNGKALIGNGGAEFDARGFVTAYDAATGEQVWRFYTVPGDPALPFENPVLEQAVETWNGEWWKYGGGGTVWDAITFDPALNLVYIGVGNGTPWNQRLRSPGGHNWHPMAYHPGTGLVYIPAQDLPWVYKQVEEFEFSKVTVNTGLDPVIASMPEDPAIQKEISELLKGYLLAWDPLGQRARWTVRAWRKACLALPATWRNLKPTLSMPT